MKKIYISFLILTVFSLGFNGKIHSQTIAKTKTSKTTWTAKNPFNTDVFVENLGQFNNWVVSENPIKYAINKGDKIFFDQQGLTFRIDKSEKIEKEDGENEKEEQGYQYETAKKDKGEPDEPVKIEKYYVHLSWEGCNKNAKIEVTDQAVGYYTFGEKGYENVKAKGYKKLTYKDLYPGVDVEYTIPEKGGIKYRLILHAGADISTVKMKYTGDVDKITIDSEGNLLINTPTGPIIDHAPKSFYETDNSSIVSAFVVNGDVVSFKLSGLNATNTILNIIVIDPWTITPTTMATDNSAYDIAYDDFGNVYFSGGTFSFKLSKYNAAGTPLWTYTNPSTWDAAATCYSKFCIMPLTGTVVIGEGFNPSGPMVQKISPSGILMLTTGNLSGNEEIWVMFYNRCTSKLVGFGGGVIYSSNMQVSADTSLTSSACSDFDGYGTSDNDIAAVVQDINGDFYALISSQVANNGHLLKSLSSSNYAPPPAWDSYSNYGNFNECANTGIPGFANMCAGPQTVRANALALNDNYLFSYDGQIVEAWNKTNGALLGSLTVNASYLGGQDRTHEGIAVDDCNNVYVGGTNQVHIFAFNGSSFTASGTIATSNEVYDVQLDRMLGTLYVSGLGFVMVTPATAACAVQQLNISDNITYTLSNCTGSATVNVTGGVSPYTYIWSNGSTTNSITNVQPGTYYVTVTDNSCIRLRGVDTVHINPGFAITICNNTGTCSGGSVQLTASGGTTYLWTPAGSLSNCNVCNPTATPASTTTYFVTVSNGACSAVDSVTVTIAPPPVLSVTNAAICNGAQASLVASGATSYTWCTGPTTATLNISPTTTTTYTVTGTDGGCTASATGVVTVNPSPNAQISPFSPATCNLINGSATATGGTSYVWNTGPTTATITGLAAGTYTVTVSDGSGCSSTTSVTINNIPPPTVSTTFTNETCGQANGTAQSTYTGGVTPMTFLWSDGQTTQNATGLTANTYTVTVTDASGCTGTSSVILSNIAGPSVAIASITNETCSTSNGGAVVSVSGGTPGFTYAWNSSPPQNTTLLQNVHAGTYTITVTDANHCTAFNTVVITNTPPPIVTVSSTNEICHQADGTATAIITGVTGNYSLMWSNGQTTASISGLVQGGYTITVTDSMCTTIENINVMETPGPQAGFSVHPRILTLMDGPVAVQDNSTGQVVSWDWNFGDGSPDQAGSNSVHQYSNLGTYIITLIVTDNNGCTDTITDSVKVKDIFTFYVPNVFTPNGDGINDLFFPQGISVDPNNYNEYIFDRWGNLVFHTSTWTGTAAEPWNGTKNNKGASSDVVLDVYVYRILLKETDGIKHEFIGRISIVP